MEVVRKEINKMNTIQFFTKSDVIECGIIFSRNGECLDLEVAKTEHLCFPSLDYTEEDGWSKVSLTNHEDCIRLLSVRS